MDGFGVGEALAAVLRQDRGRLMAALIAQLRDFDLAEEALSDAVESALVHWGRSGPPHHPQGWLLTVARRKAIDRMRRRQRQRDHAADAALHDIGDLSQPVPGGEEIPDERLRLIFTCCHPALDPKSRVALTLRTLGGLTTAEIARAFLDEEATMGQRLSRAKAKIAAAVIPYAVPGPELWAERLGSVLAVIYLIFNEGYAASVGESRIRADLCEEAIHLGRMLCALRPREPEALGLLSLMLTTHARRPARIGPAGEMIPLDRQDRQAWDKVLLAEGLGALDRAMAERASGPCQIKAAISALHGRAPRHEATDWPQMLMLYDALMRFEPSAVVRLNRAMVLSEAHGLAPALREIDALGDALDRYQPYHAAAAALLGRAGSTARAREAYGRAIALSGNATERAFLEGRRAALGDGPDQERGHRGEAARATDRGARSGGPNPP